MQHLIKPLQTPKLFHTHTHTPIGTKYIVAKCLAQRQSDRWNRGIEPPTPSVPGGLHKPLSSTAALNRLICRHNLLRGYLFYNAKGCKYSSKRNTWMSSGFTSAVCCHAAVRRRSIGCNLRTLFWVLLVGQLQVMEQDGLFKLIYTCQTTPSPPRHRAAVNRFQLKISILLLTLVILKETSFKSVWVYVHKVEMRCFWSEFLITVNTKKKAFSSTPFFLTCVSNPFILTLSL